LVPRSELIIQLHEISLKMRQLIVVFYEFGQEFLENCGIQAKIIDFVEHVSKADSISLFCCCKNHLIFERGVEMSA
jgi:hypothetical protein